MPKTISVLTIPRSLTLAFWFVLGGCFFITCFFSEAYALDAGSQIFEQNQSTNSSRDKTGEPLALPEEAPNPSPNLWITLLHLLISLVVIIGLIVLTVWGLKLVWEKKGWNQFADEGKPLKVLTSVHIAPRKAIYLVEIGNRILVVGIGSEEMNCLEVIRDPEEIKALRDAASHGFPKIFKRISQRQETTDREAETQEMFKESSQVVGEYVKKLKKMKKNKSASDSIDGES